METSNSGYDTVKTEGIRRKDHLGRSKMVLLNKFPRVVLSSTVAIIFSMATFAFTETKVFVKEYTYQASDEDSKNSSRTIALREVKRLLLEELGTYLESETEVRNFQLTKDQIIILTAGIVSAEIIDEKWDGKTYSLKAKIAADPTEVIESIDRLRQDRQKTKELEESKKQADEALKEVERLRKELKIAKGEKTKQEEYNGAINRLSATDWVERGRVLVNTVNAAEAIHPLSRAIELDPKSFSAYFYRAIAYRNLGDYQQSIKDFNKAIELDPKNALSFWGRGQTYYALDDFRRAIKDFNKASELHLEASEAAVLYYERGIVYMGLFDRPQAIKDFNKAIELDPRGIPAAYYYRGLAHAGLDGYRQAIRDFNKAIDFGYRDDGYVYYARGISYEMLDDHRRANEDFKTAARLGLTMAQDYLKSKGIRW